MTLFAVLPALLMLVGAAVCGALALLLPRLTPGVHRAIALTATAAAFAVAIAALRSLDPHRSGVGMVGFSGGLIVDRFGVAGTVLITAVVALTIGAAAAPVGRVRARSGAVCALLLVGGAASMMLVEEREMTAFAGAAAVLATTITLLTAVTKTSAAAAEAALRQVLAGGVALATALYGLTLLYAATGTTDVERLAAGAGTGGHVLDIPLVAVGVTLFAAGLLFLAAAPPLHIFARRSLLGTPAALAGYGAALGLVAATMTLARFGVEGFGAGRTRWTVIVSVLAAIAMLSGSLRALRAPSVRRLVADLATAQAGVLVLAAAATGPGLSGAPVAGPTALVYSAVAGAMALVATLAAVGILDTAGLGPAISAYRGVGRRSPVTAAVLAVGLLGLAGLPPLAGFIGRVLTGVAAVDAGSAWVAAVAALSTVVATVAVLRWLAVMYAEDSLEPPFSVATTPRSGRAAAAAAAALALVLAILAGPFVALAGGAATSLH